MFETKLYEPTPGAQRGTMASGLVNLFKPAQKKYVSTDLGTNIGRARKLGLISRDEEKLLESYRVRFRNAYSHSDKQKTFGDQTTIIQAASFEKGGIITEDPETVRLADFPIGQGLTQAYKAEAEAVPYFLQMDALVRSIRRKLFEHGGNEGDGQTPATPPDTV